MSDALRYNDIIQELQLIREELKETQIQMFQEMEKLKALFSKMQKEVEYVEDTLDDRIEEVRQEFR
jgi:hypothetical protein